MITKSRFIVVKHNADRAGLHYDLRFVMPDSDLWDSFASRKIPQLVKGEQKKILLVRTTKHSESQALFLGTLDSGYGKGTLEKWDDGKCDIIQYSYKHIEIIFHGTKLKGKYHFVRNNYHKSTFLFFKGKEDKE